MQGRRFLGRIDLSVLSVLISAYTLSKNAIAL